MARIGLEIWKEIKPLIINITHGLIHMAIKKLKSLLTREFIEDIQKD